MRNFEPMLRQPGPVNSNVPAWRDRDFLAGRFVVFSGGKFELRKGQDVVRAYKVLQDHHPDLVLVNAWFNPWPDVFGTMRTSLLIRFDPPRGPYFRRLTSWSGPTRTATLCASLAGRPTKTWPGRPGEKARKRFERSFARRRVFPERRDRDIAPYRARR